MEIAFILVLMAVVLVLFSRETVPVDSISLGVIVALLVTGILTPAEALAGFANEAVVVLAGLFVLTAGLRLTGATDGLANWVTRFARRYPRAAVPLLLGSTLVLSAFINNTTCTALFLPIGIAIAQSLKSSASRYLMPIAFASILGGTLTVMGTSTNVIVRGLMPQYGMDPLGLFELAPVAAPLGLLGIVYLVYARALLPDRVPNKVEDRFPLREYLTEVEVAERSPLIGRTVAEGALGREWNLNLLALLRGDDLVVPQPHDVLRRGDVLVVEGSVKAIEDVGRLRGLKLRPAGVQERLGSESDVHLVEAVVLPRSELEGRTLVESGFRQRYRANVIAIKRHGEVVVQELGRIRLRVGDLLLIEGGPSAPARLAAQKDLLVIEGRPARSVAPRRALLASSILVGVVALAALGPFGLVAAILIGCLALLLTRCVTPAEAYAAVDWRLLVLIVGMMAYGTAMVKTGAAAMLAEHTVDLLDPFGPLGVLAGFYLLTVALTQPMSNQAAALVVFPVAMEAAVALGFEPRAMAITVTLAASSSFLTPLEPSCLLVYGPGGYRFLDFPRLGLGLTFLAFLTTLLLVPRIWPM